MKTTGTLLMTCVALALGNLTTWAGEQLEISLIAPDSLHGWNYGEKRLPKGWQAKDGKLIGKADADGLLSGWTVGTVKIEGTAHGEAKGKLHVALVTLTGNTAAKTTIGLGEKPTEFSLKVGGGRFVVHAGDATSASASATSIKSGERYLLRLQPDGGEVTLDKLTAHAPAGEPIFNGKNTEGWWTPGKIEAWQVKDGVLIKEGKGGNYIRSEQEYENFVLSFEFQIPEGGNSGVGFRTPRDGWPSRQGMELQVLAKEGQTVHSMMSIYKYYPPLARADKTGQWNRVVIRCEGRIVSAWMNGTLVQHANTAEHYALADRPLKGWLGFQDHGARVQYRNIRVAELPDGEGPNVWYRNLVKIEKPEPKKKPEKKKPAKKSAGKKPTAKSKAKVEK